MSWLTSAIFLAIAVSKLNRYKEMEENLFGLQPQDRRHDRWGRSMENVQCSWLSIDWVKSTVVLVTKQQSDFSSCQVSDIPPPQTHTQWRPRVFLSEHFVFHWLKDNLCVSLYRNVCLYVSEWLTEKQQGIASSDRWHIEGARTHQSEEQVLTRRPSLLILLSSNNTGLFRHSSTCFVFWPFL